jgi:hypothetical protein
MKNVIVCGSFMLALCALGVLLGRTKRVSADTGEGSLQPIPPCTYQYKEFVFSLN